MTVAELIEKLKTMPQDVQVAVADEYEQTQWPLGDIELEDEYEWVGRKIVVIS